jgi:hypothetical protein
MTTYLIIVKYTRWFQKDKAQPVESIEADFFSVSLLMGGVCMVKRLENWKG